MNAFRNGADNWDEFRWEREIRRDERRINRYFRELPSCLDLPGEEEMIIDQIAAHPDLMPTFGSRENFRNWSYLANENDDGEEEDEDRASEAPARRDGQEIIDAEDFLATDWNLLTARSLRGEMLAPALSTACAYAKLLARTADFLDAREPGLRLCLGKRTLADLNELAGILAAVVRFRPSLGGAVKKHLEELGKIRELLLGRLRTQH